MVLSCPASFHTLIARAMACGVAKSQRGCAKPSAAARDNFYNFYIVAVAVNGHHFRNG